MNKLVSIIMPAFNAQNTIAISIDSVLNQIYRNWELLIVNDGSTDATRKVIDTYSDPRIRVFTKENGGVSQARNFGLDRINGEFVAFIDSDDLWKKDKLEKQVEFFDNYSSDTGLCFTKIHGFLERENFSFPMQNFELCIERDNYHNLLIYDYIPTLTVILRRDVVNQVGYFDESLRGTEDWDYWIRVAKTYKIIYINEVLAYYRVQAVSLSSDKQRHADQEWKVIQKAVLNDPMIPDRIKELSILFWATKLTYWHLRNLKFNKAFNTFVINLVIKPPSFLNTLVLINWVIRYVWARLFIRNFRKQSFSESSFRDIL